MNSRPGLEAARRVRISGRVQGVYFRASAAERAIALSLRGYAENRRDGTVLVLAAGSPAALSDLVAWLQKGPPLARVDKVEIESIDPASIEWPAGFLQS
ncbi:MAG: acylphosphatase [Steroidobacteraceae bacterium]